MVPILSWMNIVYTFPSYLPKIQSKINFPPMPMFSEWFLPFGFSDWNFALISHLSHACYKPCLPPAQFYHNSKSDDDDDDDDDICKNCIYSSNLSTLS
jgi:hypothetical protein